MRDRHRWYQRTIRKPFLLGRFGKTESLFVSATLFATLLAATGASQSHKGAKYATITNVQAREMLDKIQGDIKEYYYDPTMHGVDLDKRFDEARLKIAAAKSQDEALLSIAGAVRVCKDSHNTFRPH